MATVRRDTQQRHETMQTQQPPAEQQGGVPPELLVEALSGHEDGLLAIAEKLMEQYDAGYDVMGEAIIDAFADVQKLFQHVVEAAHMEGAAFEASRRQDEGTTPTSSTNNRPSTNHSDEFVDQDVKDILSQAIQRGSSLRNNPTECARHYATACTDASALLPVDSESRSRLSLALERATSLPPDRACAILRYTMDDVVRSGTHTTPLPDPSQRQDMVLDCNMSATNTANMRPDQLTSLTAELRDILQAPLYHGTPLQATARRFWAALEEHQSAQQRKAERLEEKLAQLKADFLLARAEWEEKLNQVRAEAAAAQEQDTTTDDNDTLYGGSVKSVASGMSGLARLVAQQHSQFQCGTTHHEPTSVVVDTARRSRSRSRSRSTRSFREYSKSPHRGSSVSGV